MVKETIKFNSSWTEEEKEEIKQLLKIILQAILAN